MKRVLLFAALATMLASCITYQKCLDKFGVTYTDSVMVKHTIDTTLRVPIVPDSLEVGINLDTLCAGWYYWNTMVADSLVDLTDSLYVQHKNARQSVSHWIDRYNRLLKIKNTILRDTIEVHFRDTVTLQAPCPQVQFDKDKDVPWFRALWYKYQLFAAWALLVLILVLIFLKQIKSLFK